MQVIRGTEFITISAIVGVSILWWSLRLWKPGRFLLSNASQHNTIQCTARGEKTSPLPVSSKQSVTLHRTHRMEFHRSLVRGIARVDSMPWHSSSNVTTQICQRWCNKQEVVHDHPDACWQRWQSAKCSSCESCSTGLASVGTRHHCLSAAPALGEINQKKKEVKTSASRYWVFIITWVERTLQGKISD